MKLRFARSRQEAGGATTFIFEGDDTPAWTAGQSIKLEVPGAYGPLSHRFTISAAPYERHIAITTKHSSSEYKTSLFSLVPGDEISAFAVDGSFTWRDSRAAHIFVAAGIGITPYISMLKERVYRSQNIPAALLYSSSTADIVFGDYVRTLADTHPEFRTRFIVGGRVNAADVHRVAAPAQSLIYISGPSMMVDGLSTALHKEYGIPESRLMRDWFIGRLAEEG